MFIIKMARSTSLFIFFWPLLLSLASTTSHATLVDLIYQLEVSHPSDCIKGQPDVNCVSGDLSGTAGFFTNSFPATMELRYQYDTTATPVRVVPNQLSDYRMSNVEIRIGDHVLLAKNEDQVAQSFISVDQTFDEDIFVIGTTGGIIFDFVDGPLVGDSIDAHFLPHSVFRTSDTEHLKGFGLPEPSLLEGFESISHDFNSDDLIQFDDGLGLFAVRWEITDFNIESQSVVYEPSTIALLALGLVGVGYQRRKRLAV